MEYFLHHDYVLYVLILQTLPLIAILDKAWSEGDISFYVAGCQIILIGFFFVAWGGYSTDAWRYLDGFDRFPLSYRREWAFWTLGSALSVFLHDPWSMKIYSVICTGVAACGVVYYLSRFGALHVVIGLFVLVSLPIFVFAFGNAVRQGMGMAIMLPAIIFLAEGRRKHFWVLTIIAVMFHVSVIVLAVAALLAMLSPRLAVPALIFSPVAGLVIPELLMSAGVDPASWIPYAYREEGSLYIMKFVIMYPAAWLVYLVRERQVRGQSSIELTFVYAACFSFLLLAYEVPFERLLLNSLVVLCLIVPVLVLRFVNGTIALGSLWVGGMLGTVLIWTHDSSAVALGYAH